MRRRRLTSEVARAAGFLEDRLGAAPYGRPHVEVVDGLGYDAIARPGRLLFDSKWLAGADDAYLRLTVAHEMAHQWWGLLVAGEPFLREPAAEFWAWRAIGETVSAQAERHQLLLARGRLARYAAGDGGPQAEEDRRLGRDALALHAWWRRDPPGAEGWMRARVDAAARDGRLPPPDALERWASSTGIPAPAARDGVVVDTAATGLETLLAVSDGAARGTSERWFAGELALGPQQRVADDQLGPVLAGDLGGALQLIAALPGRSADA